MKANVCVCFPPPITMKEKNQPSKLCAKNIMQRSEANMLDENKSAHMVNGAHAGLSGNGRKTMNKKMFDRVFTFVAGSV